MHSHHFESVVIHHDGDFSGPMYVRQLKGRAVVTTPTLLKECLKDQPEGEWLTLSGPDGDIHDRHEVTTEDGEHLVEVAWTNCTIPVRRSDIQMALIASRTTQIIGLTEQVACGEGDDFSAIMQTLDDVIQRLTAISKG